MTPSRHVRIPPPLEARIIGAFPAFCAANTGKPANLSSVLLWLATRALDALPAGAVHAYAPHPHHGGCETCGQASHHPSHRRTA